MRLKIIASYEPWDDWAAGFEAELRTREGEDVDLLHVSTAILLVRRGYKEVKRHAG